jgi:hypothetical protein
MGFLSPAAPPRPSLALPDVQRGSRAPQYCKKISKMDEILIESWNAGLVTLRYASTDYGKLVHTFDALALSRQLYDLCHRSILKSNLRAKYY